MTKVKIDKEKCFACGACVQVCPRKAITFVEDNRGFVFPNIDEALCVNCGLCEKVCPYKNVQTGNTMLHSYLYAHNKRVLRYSTSGGAFTAISDYVLSQGGSIFGTKLADNLDAVVVEAVDSNERDSMRGSIYCQSKNIDSYIRILNYLDNGRLVLFIGTSCQVAGLYTFLGNRAEDPNLITVDFLCHGVPSNHFLKDHIHFLEDEYNKHIVKYTFRDKKYSWFSHGIEEAICDDGTSLSNNKTQIYNLFFQKNLSLRDSCFECPYRSTKRISDITIGDFWGVKEIDGKKHRMGASLIVTNTDKGEMVVHSIKGGNLQEVPIERIIHRFRSEPIKAQANRDKFWDSYIKNGYSKLVSEYSQPGGVLGYELKKYFRRIISFVSFAVKK